MYVYIYIYIYITITLCLSIISILDPAPAQAVLHGGDTIALLRPLGPDQRLAPFLEFRFDLSGSILADTFGAAWDRGTSPAAAAAAGGGKVILLSFIVRLVVIEH